MIAYLVLYVKFAGATFNFEVQLLDCANQA